MSINEIILYFLIFIICFSLLGFFFSRKPKEKPTFYNRICPCRKMADDGSLSKICIYIGAATFLYSTTYISLAKFINPYINLIFLLSFICVFIGWKLKLS
ncbi:MULTISPECIES: hypothetical protein [unclassified Campylobacter]|uniref:hypothetical protein n=1 Tax=unclassified Campylobacter TaxID=2593542 RepID=UPI00123818F4|nr:MULTISPECIES: hypothetical protein [unclassified Campylobacter]KAA6224971.1 hypothetical protein FMM55_08205 [Campylobacter sp. LR196d]KAA6225293.1 hypothetical protein FMM57_07885 [Campylobacter sp. LR286c]KAA6225588.1 hypothetical protein FMM54_06035 [Campylobacter sp. LR185c]KAA6230418.1 hypothetical protein FMM58_05375 [Campylobacter sp. LR291e]KAA6230557.1 hypothetical protein FMM56_06065 [Campylobacter sp. LR264d]